MSSAVLLTVVIAYFLLLLGIAFYTSRHSNNESFYIGNRSSKWWVVAFGMVGTSLSGMTFISVPGTVGTGGFGYFQVVIGYWLGYFAVAYILLPIYYKMQLTSIYTYLERRLGVSAYKTGALFFILSRTLGATLRLYLVIKVLEKFILEDIGISFEVTTIVILVLILLYTFRGGVKTIVWTDTLQTTFMLLSLLVCVGFIMSELNLDLSGTWQAMEEQGYTKMIYDDGFKANYFWKQVLGGAFITITMTGMDQEMMQKNISVRTLKDSQKNIIVLSFLQAFVVFVFLMLGGLLYLYASTKGGIFEPSTIDGVTQMNYYLEGTKVAGDDIYPVVAFNYLPGVISIVFIVGLISALFPSADGALTALTSSFCIDILGLKRREDLTEKQKERRRLIVHNLFALIFLGCIFFFREVDNGSLIKILLEVAGYTYGPLLALFAFGIFTKRGLHHASVPIVCVATPIFCYFLKQNDTLWFNGYAIGFELLIINAALTYLLLFLFSKKNSEAKALSEQA